MRIKKIIEKIEGEAELSFEFKDGKIDEVEIDFGIYRGIERILKGRPPKDALVITPRVCGICNHAHLIASVRALEDGYREAGVEIKLSKKAESIREFTLACELIQNHIKWLYLIILPKLERLLEIDRGVNYTLKASYLSHIITKALSIFGGQWPHSSYAVVGGVTCDPTHLDIMGALSIIEESIKFFEQSIIDIDISRFLSMDSINDLKYIGGDLGRVLNLLEVSGMAEVGKSHNRFIVFGESLNLGFRAGKYIKTELSNINTKFVKEYKDDGSHFKSVLYKDRLFEVGSLARGMVSKEPIINALHKRYRDSTATRVFARVYEIALMLDYSRSLLTKLELSEPSCTVAPNIKIENFKGVGVVEASRGSLIHKLDVRDFKIENYEIIVPTQWNLSRGDSKERGVAVEAMVGTKSIEEAEFIFRTFDVCSVCTQK